MKDIIIDYFKILSQHLLEGMMKTMRNKQG